MSSLRRLLVHVGDNGLDELLVSFAAVLAALTSMTVPVLMSH